MLYEGGVGHVVIAGGAVVHAPHPRGYAAVADRRSPSGVVIGDEELFALELLDDAESALYVVEAMTADLDDAERGITEESVTAMLTRLQRHGLMYSYRERLPVDGIRFRYPEIPEYGAERQEIIWWGRTGAGLEVVLGAAHDRA